MNKICTRVQKIINENCSAIYELGENGITNISIDEDNGILAAIVKYGETKTTIVYGITTVDYEQRTMTEAK